MIRTALLRRFAFSAGLLALTVLTTFAADRKFETPAPLKIEISQLAKMLEQYHYNREAVRPSKYAEVINDFMGDLDGQRLFFFSTDKSSFEKRFSNSLYYNIHDLGNIDTAYEIFYTYETRAQARVQWILSELKKDFDFSVQEFYRLDRSKAEWPDSISAADKLWRQRLKFELLSEIMNKKTAVEAKDIVRKRYERMVKNIADIDQTEISELFLTTITRLFDPHSSYFSAQTYEEFGISMKLQLVGIGALLGVEDDICVIREIVPGGPADLDKRLKPNDKIMAVAQGPAEPTEVIGMKLRRIVNLIRGAKGTDVRLIIQPADAADSSIRKEIVLHRDVVKLNSARAHAAIFDVPSADGKTKRSLGVISLPSFYGGESDTPGGEKTSASRDVGELLKRLQTEKIDGVVLDLRRNGGGLLSEAIETTGLFIGSGPVVQVKDFEGKTNVDGDDDPRIAYAGPLAVLVDRFSASASEIVAGALQNYGRAIIVGDSSTHGKGTVQTVIEMKNVSPLMRSASKSGAAKITIQKFYLPSGASTQRKGVVPDIVLPSFEDYIPMIGEADFTRALVWDEIRPSFFDGQPLSPKIVTPLREASLRRQAELPEFAYLRKNIDWFKSRQEQKVISLNLAERQKQKDADLALDKQFKAQKDELAKGDFSYREIRLTPKPPPRIKAPAKKDTPADGEDADLSTDGDEDVAKLDIHLREALRVVNDALQLASDPKLWASDATPLTVQAMKRS